MRRGVSDRGVCPSTASKNHAHGCKTSTDRLTWMHMFPASSCTSLCLGACGPQPQHTGCTTLGILRGALEAKAHRAIALLPQASSSHARGDLPQTRNTKPTTPSNPKPRNLETPKPKPQTLLKASFELHVPGSLVRVLQRSTKVSYHGSVFFLKASVRAPIKAL